MRTILSFALFVLANIGVCYGFGVNPPRSPVPFTFIPHVRTHASSTALHSSGTTSSSQPKPTKKYEPKWKKKQTLNEQLHGSAPPAFEEVGIKGDVPVVFRQGNVTKMTMAMRGQPMRDVATQAGQFIKYGCGKGECGTCEAMVQGKWVRPCTALIPADVSSSEDFVIVVKEVKSKSTSSGKFFSVKSFLMGFWNNILGMVGFVKSRRDAKRSWSERKEYEDLVKQKALEKKMQRQRQQQGLAP
jgi:2Fe-2S iron-sulfur cluster binding domain